MADPAPLDFMQKRKILYARGQDGARQSKAEEFVRAGRLAEALELLERVEDNDALLKDVCSRAIEGGDAFSLGRAAQLMKNEPEARDWTHLAERALSGQRYYDAIRALERAGEEDRAEEIRLEHCPDYIPFKPANK